MKQKIKIIILLLLIPVLIYLWPVQLYGDTSYIMLIGQSMHGTIESGTFIIAKPDPQYYIGDIIAFVNEHDRSVVHRIVEQTDDGFITKGDNNPRNDPKVIPFDHVLGRVLFVIPYVGFTTLFLQTSVGMSIFGILILTVFASKKSKKKKLTNFSSVIVFKIAFIASVVNYVLTLMIIGTNIQIAKTINIPFSDYFEPSIANTLYFCSISIVIFVLYLIDHSLDKKKTEDTKYLKLIFSLAGIMVLLLQLISIVNTIPFFSNLINEQGWVLNFFN
ncbi:signal peptidase I [Candidatus Nitrosarchaeum limnium]|uniref:Signal peptidase I n=1 Tax=Candidatus Nitrosarchaeum limnium BG20 TaxID=859192 RepID=S2E060_9ARCH|nr:signal peptidase I [Candidatus Nitrosarchaeum limnium]EPA04318.1 signal peptidase I [Candidatus Nitrosarchaeum limnium BG20]